MANLIITVIAIALVAVASLMGAYYGGSAFLTNQQAANASSVLNACNQFNAAWQAYLNDSNYNAPTTLNALTQNNYLTNGSYLAGIPLLPPGAGGIPQFPIFVASATATINGVAASHYFAYADLGRPASGATASATERNAPACVRIQKTATGVASPTLSSVGQGNIATAGNTKFGCAILTGSITNGLGGATVPSGDLTTGDYVMEYLLQ